MQTQKQLFEIATPRQWDILGYVWHGLVNDDIAGLLFITPRTVETHRNNLYKKAGCKNVVMLIRRLIDEKCFDENWNLKKLDELRGRAS